VPQQRRLARAKEPREHRHGDLLGLVRRPHLAAFGRGLCHICARLCCCVRLRASRRSGRPRRGNCLNSWNCLALPGVGRGACGGTRWTRESRDLRMCARSPGWIEGVLRPSVPFVIALQPARAT
jgi:hypothetical protein